MWSKRRAPAHTSRRISGDQGSPITSKVRAMEHVISPNRVLRMAAIQQVGFPYGTSGATFLRVS